jgi:hypothetical protein
MNKSQQMRWSRRGPISCFRFVARSTMERSAQGSVTGFSPMPTRTCGRPPQHDPPFSGYSRRSAVSLLKDRETLGHAPAAEQPRLRVRTLGERERVSAIPPMQQRSPAKGSGRGYSRSLWPCVLPSSTIVVDRASTSVAPMGSALLAMRAYLAAAGMALSLVAVWASIVFASNAQVILAL